MTFVYLCGLTTGSAVCTNCQAGKYSAAVAATTMSTCLNCVAGKYSAAGAATTMSTCLNCVAGKYSPTEGTSASFARSVYRTRKKRAKGERGLPDSMYVDVVFAEDRKVFVRDMHALFHLCMGEYRV
jgi:hypothetical protein